MRDFLDLMEVDLGPTRDGSPLVREGFRRALSRRVSDKREILRYRDRNLAAPLDYYELPEDINLRFDTLGIYSSGYHTHFTFRPGPTKTAAALRHPKRYAAYMRHLLRTELRREFGHAVPLLFVVECKDPEGDEHSDPPHLQGVVGVPYTEAARLREVLLTVGRPYADLRFEKYRAAWSGQPYNLFKWMGYNAKSFELTSKRVPGNLIVCSHAVTREARAIYSETCAIIMAARDKPSSLS
ncbi:hypothetical protein FHP25_32740 [Vineibacter terrae]|uniref:Uncharacterized protein n=1 Tax=Vineibacter terrae TaxID=2586908 RepID=A0A5C8PCA1_9HYPH|nr:hypothetical protein [Vineibacter terrae]TXL70887.1 hypothetical protein FHP25_32740 [Vineibacter terrae]